MGVSRITQSLARRDADESPRHNILDEILEVLHEHERQCDLRHHELARLVQQLSEQS